MKQAYIFRGAPASGKGTIVTAFAKSLEGKVARLDHDVFRWGFHLIGREVPDVNQDEHKRAFRNLLAVLEEYCKQGDYTMVVDGLFTWDDESSNQGSIKTIVEVLNRYGFVYKSIVITADKTVLEERNSQRSYVVMPIDFERLYKGVMSKIDPSEVVIDSTNQTPEQTLIEVKRLTA